VLPYKPNVIIINAGTNDANGNVDIGNAGLRMRRMLMDLWEGEGMRETCVMLSTLLPTTHSVGRNTRLDINQQYRNLVAELYSTGKCIYLADMDPPGTGNGWITISGDMDANEVVKIHPNVSIWLNVWDGLGGCPIAY
jgi:hypothetical protein